MSAKDNSKPKDSRRDTLLSSYDWSGKPPTRDTDAACETVLRDRGRTR